MNASKTLTAGALLITPFVDSGFLFAAAGSELMIGLGQPYAEAERLLTASSISKTELQMVATDQGVDLKFFKIDEDSYLIISRSKASGEIVQLSLCYFPPKPIHKGDRLVRSIRNIRFEKDGSYIVQFEPRRNP
ncbi:MAG: hypothetical protein EOP84_23835 [Verrucomicrobiaceae bacterium]|nr:MAG: hypothetical protein EOP84_23835 [Verrucomicrobiaceae bacterium]